MNGPATRRPDFSRRSIGKVLAAAWLVALMSLAAQGAAAQENRELIGRWDLTVSGVDGDYPSWIEVRLSGYRTLVGSYVAQFGSARPIAEVTTDGNAFRFSVPQQFERRSEPVVVEGTVDGDALRGRLTDERGEWIEFRGSRAPRLAPPEAVRDGETIEPFDGRSLDGWVTRFPDQENGWEVKEGVLTNVRPGNDLRTERTFRDFRLTVEFRYPEGSNSGIYLRGRHEVQIEDNFGREADSHRIGGVYGFLTPSVNAAKRAGEWQQIEIELIGRQVTVILNGQRVIDRQTIPGITGGALDSREGEPGPILLQGDHGPVEYRRVTLTELLEAK